MSIGHVGPQVLSSKRKRKCPAQMIQGVNHHEHSSMFEFTETISIEESPAKIWETLLDIEKWWPPSNPEHISIDVRSSERPLGVGTEITFEEKVAGIKAKAKGSIARWIPGREATWEGKATYRYCGISIHIREGVSWSIESHDRTSNLSASVWAMFPPTVFGRITEWYATTLLNVVDRDREHARCELEYLKRVIENTI